MASTALQRPEWATARQSCEVLKSPRPVRSPSAYATRARARRGVGVTPLGSSSTFRHFRHWSRSIEAKSGSGFCADSRCKIKRLRNDHHQIHIADRPPIDADHRLILRVRPDHGPGSVSLFVGAPQCTGDLVVVRIPYETDQCGSADHRPSQDWDWADVVPAGLVRGHEVKIKPGLI